jgi:NADH-quinone oxidoreductase subunit N
LNLDAPFKNYILEYFFSLILFNVIIYIFSLVFFFSVFFLFDTRLFRTLSEYKFFKTNSFINSTLVIIFFSLAGVPPFLGFLGKFLLFLSIFATSHYFFFLVFLIFNLFVIFFYIQNIRFLFGKSQSNIYIFKKFKVHMDFSIILILVFFNFINVAGIFLFDHLLIFILQISYGIFIF